MEKREQLKDELQLIDQYKEVVVHLAESLHDLDNSPRLAVMPFLVERQEDLARSEAELNTALADRYLLVAAPTGRLVAAVIITLKREAEVARGILAHEGWRDLPRVGEYARMDLTGMAARLTARSQSVPRELTALAEEMDRLRHEAGTPLQSLGLRAADEVSRLHTLRAMGSGHYGFALCGWVPVSLKPRVTEVLDHLDDQVLYTFEPAQEHHEPERIPVLLENPAWVRPFEALISFLSTPALRQLGSNLGHRHPVSVLGRHGHGGHRLRPGFCRTCLVLTYPGEEEPASPAGIFQNTAGPGPRGAGAAHHDTHHRLDGSVGPGLRGMLRQPVPAAGHLRNQSPSRD